MKNDFRYWFTVFFIICICLCIKFFLWGLLHTETDEAVFWSLAQNLINKGEYNLLGTDILETLSKYVYNHPLFNHPPFFPILLIPFVIWGSQKSAIIISWSGHLLCILSLSIIIRRLQNPGKTDLKELQVYYWMPLLALAFDPVMNFISRRLWIDSILSGLISMSIASAFLAVNSKNIKLYAVFSGFFLGLAMLSKLTAAIAFPVIFYIIIFSGISNSEKIKVILTGSLPVLILSIPWFILFYRCFGVFMPSWIKPDKWMIENNPFMYAVMNRHAVYYLIKLILINPLCLFCLIYYIFSFFKKNDFDFFMPFFWFICFFGAITIISARGQGFQMRHLAPLYPSIYLMLFYVINKFKANICAIAFVFTGIVFNLIEVLLYVFIFYNHAEYQSIFELFGFVRIL